MCEKCENGIIKKYILLEYPCPKCYKVETWVDKVIPPLSKKEFNNEFRAFVSTNVNNLTDEIVLEAKKIGCVATIYFEEELCKEENEL